MNIHEIKSQNKALAGLREEQRVHDKALEGARAEQAKVRTTVMQLEKKIKKAEKALDGKVSLVLVLVFWAFDANSFFQRPDLVATEAQITHATRKLNNAQKTREEVGKSEENLRLRVNGLQKELVSVKKAADAAQGGVRCRVPLFINIPIPCLFLQRHKEKRLSIIWR